MQPVASAYQESQLPKAQTEESFGGLRVDPATPVLAALFLLQRLFSTEISTLLVEKGLGLLRMVCAHLNFFHVLKNKRNVS